jgi:hypothetical protein
VRDEDECEVGRGLGKKDGRVSRMDRLEGWAESRADDQRRLGDANPFQRTASWTLTLVGMGM